MKVNFNRILIQNASVEKMMRKYHVFHTLDSRTNIPKLSDQKIQRVNRSLQNRSYSGNCAEYPPRHTE